MGRGQQPAPLLSSWGNLVRVEIGGERLGVGCRSRRRRLSFPEGFRVFRRPEIREHLVQSRKRCRHPFSLCPRRNNRAGGHLLKMRLRNSVSEAE
jgi:hypothetical protein